MNKIQLSPRSFRHFTLVILLVPIFVNFVASMTLFAPPNNLHVCEGFSADDGCHRLRYFKLIYSQVPVKTLPDGFLSNLTRLRSVTIIDASLISLPVDLLAGSDNVESLDLSTNRLSALKDGFLDHLKVLLFLDLSYNLFTQISS